MGYMRKIYKNIILGILMCTCLFCTPVRAAENFDALFEKGYTLASSNEYEEAAEYFTKALETAIEQGMPINEYIFCYKNLAICYSKLGRNLKAIENLEEYERFLTENGYTNDLAEIYVLIAQYYYNESLYSRTIEYGNKVLEIGHQEMNPPAYRIMGLAYMAEELYEEAYSCFEIYLDTSDNYLHAIDLLAQCYEGMGKYRQAIDFYLEIASVPQYTVTYTEKAVKAYLKDASLSEEEKDAFVQTYLVSELGYTEMELESFYFSNRNYDKIFDNYYRVLQGNPNDINTLFNLGGAKCNNGEYEEAEEAFRRVCEMEPDNVTAVLYWGFALEGLGRYEGALEKYNEVLAKEPYNEQAVLGIKDCYLAMGDKQAAAEVLNNAIMRNPDASDTLFYYYVSLNQNFTASDFSDAIAYYSQSDSWPTDEKKQAYFVINNIWISYLEPAKLDAYIRYLESQDTEDYLIATELGCAYRAKGDYVTALDYFEKVKTLNKYDEEDMWEEQIYTLHVAREYETTINMAFEGAIHYPDNEIFPYYKAFVDMLYNQNYESAIEIGNELLEKNAKSINALELLYITYFEMGDYDSALKYVNKYLEVNKNSYYAKAYKLRILWESNQNDAKLEEELLNLPLSESNANVIYANAILGYTDKVKESLPGYLAMYPTEYAKACVVENSAMKDVIKDTEIALILGLDVDVSIREDKYILDDTETESIDIIQSTDDKKVEDITTNPSMTKRVVVGAIGTLLGVLVIVFVMIRRSLKQPRA